MAKNGKRHAIWVSGDLWSRVAALRIIEEEPMPKVIARLLAEHESNAPTSPQASSGASEVAPAAPELKARPPEEKSGFLSSITNGRSEEST